MDMGGNQAGYGQTTHEMKANDFAVVAFNEGIAVANILESDTGKSGADADCSLSPHRRRPLDTCLCKELIFLQIDIIYHCTDNVT